MCQPWKQFEVYSTTNVECQLAKRILHLRHFWQDGWSFYGKPVHSSSTLTELALNAYGLVMVIQPHVVWGKLSRVFY